MATKERRAMTKLAACLGIGAIQFLYGLRKRAFNAPPISLESVMQRLKADANFSSPICQSQCFTVECDHIDMGIGWSRKCALYRPAFRKSGVQGAFGYSNLLCPSWDTLRYPIEFNHLNAGAINGLLLWCCPTTICRPIIIRALFAMTTRIAKQAIDSVNAVRCGRFRSHIGVEVLKRLPVLAYCYAGSTVGGKGFQVRIITTLLHVEPRAMFRRIGHAMSSFAAWIATVAKVLSQTVSLDRFFCSALAAACPVDVLRWMVCCFTENRPFAEAFPSQVFEVSAPTSRLCLRHAKSPIQVSWVKVQRELQLLSVPFHFSTFAIGVQS